MPTEGNGVKESNTAKEPSRARMGERTHVCLIGVLRSLKRTCYNTVFLVKYHFCDDYECFTHTYEQSKRVTGSTLTSYQLPVSNI